MMLKRIKGFFFANNFPRLREISAAILYFISILGIDLIFRAFFAGNNKTEIKSSVPFIFTICWCVILSAVSLLLPRIIRRIYYILTALVFAVFALVHAFFDSFFGTYMSLSATTFAGEGAAYFEWSYFDISKKLVVLLVAMVMISVFAALILPKIKYNVLRVIIPILVFALAVVGITTLIDRTFTDEGGIKWNSTRSLSDTYDEFTDTQANMHICGLYHYTYRDFMISTGLQDLSMKLTSKGIIDELDAYYASKEIDADNEMTGIFKGKNLILIQLESVDTWSLTEVAMPNLYKIQQESIDFTNYYAPKYLWGATFNAENIVNTGMVSPLNSSKMTYFTDVSYPYSLPALFQKEDYTVNSFHRSNSGTYSRGEVHENWGYTKYHAGYDMQLDNYNMDSGLMKAYDLFTPDGSFMSFIITYTGHGPFSAEHEAVKKYEDIIRSQLPEDAEDEYVYALCNAYETDVFIGQLFEKLDSDGLLENTVVAFYSDHYNHYVTDAAILAKYKGTDNTNLYCKIPFFIYSKDTEAMSVDKVIATYDILPTLVNLFDLDTDGRYYIGNDAFSENGGYAFYSDRSWVDKDMYFNISSSEATELSASRDAEITERLNASWNAIKIDYFKLKGLE